MPIADDLKNKVLSQLVPALVNRKVIAANVEATTKRATFDAAVLAERTARDEFEAASTPNADPQVVAAKRKAMLEAHAATAAAKLALGEATRQVEYLGTAQAAIDVLFENHDDLADEAMVDVLIAEIELEVLTKVIEVKQASLAADQARLAELEG